MTNPAPSTLVGYPDGTDFEWCGCDADGHIAVFTTAGLGPIPAAVLRDSELTHALLESVRSLPSRGGATMLVRLPRPDDFVQFACRGLFAYDWQDAHRTNTGSGGYELLARPHKPLHVSELPAEVQPLLRELILADVRFADNAVLDVRKHFDCEPAI